MILLAVTPVSTLSALTEEPQPASEGKIVNVSIQNFAFNPASVQISIANQMNE